ncbi:tRNA 2-selenouridine(34) synthase MnmH [Geomonas subterranea]|uniref:tRNA 2-selenouridine(34) synthase MnmH n=1 Tax=Geomonas subterranea TaxID=2847989 RepID=A0ABX8LMK4_9BACT|nr:MULTISPECIES: tRNA 2-selenouridine(34) synthase MnmH [Geomonas]QXE91463.1 tRNA 2-selenouridine(34) synthase MnmH [Geomonas subterranea]QXM10449.1 tRNA 2-selenouridine(34) synthase MnmH [Geomonas subterranea]
METTPFNEELLDSHLLVDVRSPLEYAEDHIPGAINVPLLDNDERVEIGILHKEQGPYAARRRGLELTAHRFPEMVRQICDEAGGRPILVYCWRGGLRSKTVTSILDLAGLKAVQLIGGYKSYRHVVSEYFTPYTPKKPLIVLHGMTGIGKTTLLQRLKERGNSVLDLEGLACHRGSAFGQLGLNQDLTQKRFETLLWDAIRKAPAGRPLILEGESERIGRVSLPGDFYQKMAQGIRVWCHATLETRVRRLIEEYGLPEYKEEMGVALQRIRKKLGGKRCDELAGNLERWEMEEFMKGLVCDYYDKVYYKNRTWEADYQLDMEDFDRAAGELEQFLAAQSAR